MTMTYKVWVHIEEIDEEQDHYEDVDLPEGLGVFDTHYEAKEFVATLHGHAWLVEKNDDA